MRIIMTKRKLSLTLAMAAMLVALSVAPALADPIGWTSFVIRNSTAGAVAPTITEKMDGSVEFLITLPGQKAGLGSNALSGMTFGDIAELSIVRLDDYTRFTAGSGPYVAPYMNFWVTNGAGKFALIANEPSNPEWTGQTEWNADWATLQTKTAKVYETADKSWLPNSGVGLKFGDLAGYEILAPTAAQLTTGWAGLGTGAARELGTNQAFAFNWVFGDSLSNYVSGDPGYLVANPVANPVATAPEPGSTLLLLGAGLVGLTAVRRRMRE